MLLHGRRGFFRCKALDIAGGDDWRDGVQRRNAGRVAPEQEITRRTRIRLAGVLVADRRREEFQKAKDRIVARVCRAISSPPQVMTT
jgi:hypothetical protein